VHLYFTDHSSQPIKMHYRQSAVHRGHATGGFSNRFSKDFATGRACELPNHHDGRSSTGMVVDICFLRAPLTRGTALLKHHIFPQLLYRSRGPKGGHRALLLSHFGGAVRRSPRSRPRPAHWLRSLLFRHRHGGTSTFHHRGRGTVDFSQSAIAHPRLASPARHSVARHGNA